MELKINGNAYDTLQEAMYWLKYRDLVIAMDGRFYVVFAEELERLQRESETKPSVIADRLEELAKLHDKLARIFQPDGNCPTLGDPYREQTEAAKLIFEEDGQANPQVIDWLERFIVFNPVKPLCDAVKIILAYRFSENTKGHYTAKYLWR